VVLKVSLDNREEMMMNQDQIFRGGVYHGVDPKSTREVILFTKQPSVNGAWPAGSVVYRPAGRHSEGARNASAAELGYPGCFFMTIRAFARWARSRVG